MGRGFFQAIESRLLQSEPVFLALVVEHTAHSPGTSGARMAVFLSGESVGTIGGGAMELDVISRARETLPGTALTPELRRLIHRANAHEQASGLICAGEQSNLYVWLDPSRDLAAIRTAAECERRPNPGRLSISPLGLTCAAGPLAPDEVAFQLHRNEGTWTYTEQLLNMKRIAVLGAGHCGRALAQTLCTVGYHVTVADTRPALVNLATHATDHVIVSDMTEAATLVSHPEMTPLVVMGADLNMDVQAITGALHRPFPFIGVMGSPAKIAEIRKRLAAAGFTQTDLDRITAPVGLSIGSRTPEEIAISVAAQLLARQ